MTHKLLFDYEIDGYNRQDQFGYYTVGEFKTYSKLEAIELANKTNSKPNWHFNDNVFQSLDWTKEPADSLAEIYKRRAQQLRETYDYLVLWYSGGADSNNILNVFLDNDIKLDEVVSYINYEGSDDKENDLNGEIFFVAVPDIKAAQLRQPDLKHRIIDMSQYMAEHFAKVDLDWIYEHNGMFTPIHQTKSKIKTKIPDWYNLFAQGKKVGFISGIDKPCVVLRNDNNYYFNFHDFTIDNSVTPGMQMANHPWDFNEFFYWTPDCPNIILKQTHMIKHALKARSFGQISDWSSPMTPSGSLAKVQTADNKFQWVDTTGLIKLIYPNWKPIPYQIKAKSTILYDKDMWFIRQGNQEKSLKNWINGLTKVLSVTGRNSRDHYNATDQMHSCAYCLGN